MAERYVVSTIVAITIVVLVTGCATISGSAIPSPVTQSGIGPAPTVQHPLNPAPMIAAPCRTLTSTQTNLPGLRITAGPGHLVADADGPTCEWRDAAKKIVLRVTWLTSNLTLADMYAHWSSYTTWSPFTESSYPPTWQYPGVIASKGSQDSDVYLAVNDQTLCVIHYYDPQWPHPEGPSSIVRSYASDVIANLEHI